jgi:TonB family protein
MDSFALYILKVCLGITVFVVPYYFFLRNDTALLLKRFFLLGGVFASFLFPLLALKRPVMVELYSPSIPFEPDYVLPEMEVLPIEATPGFAIQWPTVLMAIYLCGALILLFRNVFLLLKWNAVWKKAERKNTGVAYSANDEVFAMFTRIFLPNNLQNSRESDAILIHEKAHIRQLHFIDLIILELTMLLTWFNPFTWLLVYLVKENHEHLADRMALEEGVDSTDYRTQLLNQAMGVQVFSLAHPFNHSSIKKRFEMMKKSGSIRSAILKVSVLLPLILVSLGFAVGKARQGNTISGKVVFSDTGEPAHGASIVVKNTTTGTVADAEGNYKLELKGRAEVVFSFVGYKTQSYWFKPGEYRFVTLEREIINLIPPVIMIDGVKSDYNSLDEIDPDIIASIKSFDRFGKEGGKDMYLITTKKGKTSGTEVDKKMTRVHFNGKFTWMTGLREYMGLNMKNYNIDMNKLAASGLELSFFVEEDGQVLDVEISNFSHPDLNNKEVEAFSRDLADLIQSSGRWTPPSIDGKPHKVKLLIRGNNWNYLGEYKKVFTKEDTNETEEVFYVVEDMPKFNNGNPAIEFKKYIAQNLRYPKDEADKGINGRVIVQFTVNTDGSVGDAEVVSGVSPGLNSEAIRVVESSPPWTPGKQRGKAVAVKFTFPVSFEFSESIDIVPGKPLEEGVFYIVEEMPKFNNGDPAIEFRKYIASNLRYPKEEAEKGMSGRVIVQFKVTPDGNVGDVKVLVGASPGLDQEAIRVVESSPAWTPGKQKGKAVNVLFTFPINFVVDNKKGKSATDNIGSNNQVPKTKTAWRKVDQMAEYPGGMDEFPKFLASNLRYPVYAYDNQMEGEVTIEVVVNENGKVDLINEYVVPDEQQYDPFTHKPVTVVSYSRGEDRKKEQAGEMAKNALVQEVLRVLLNSPDWIKPAVKDGKPAAMVMRVPVKFQLQDRGKPSSQSRIPGFIILVETLDDKIKLTGIKGCAWTMLTFTPTIPYIDQNGVTMAPTIREKSDNPNLSTFLFRLARIENKIELTGIHGTNFKKLSWSWEKGECRQLIDQNGMLETK